MQTTVYLLLALTAAAVTGQTVEERLALLETDLENEVSQLLHTLETLYEHREKRQLSDIGAKLDELMRHLKYHANEIKKATANGSLTDGGMAGLGSKIDSVLTSIGNMFKDARDSAGGVTPSHSHDKRQTAQDVGAKLDRLLKSMKDHLGDVKDTVGSPNMNGAYGVANKTASVYYSLKHLLSDIRGVFGGSDGGHSH